MTASRLCVTHKAGLRSPAIGRLLISTFVRHTGRPSPSCVQFARQLTIRLFGQSTCSLRDGLVLCVRITSFSFGLFNFSDPLAFGAIGCTRRPRLLPFSEGRIGGSSAKPLQRSFLCVRRCIPPFYEIQISKPSHLSSLCKDLARSNVCSTRIPNAPPAYQLVVYFDCGKARGRVSTYPPSFQSAPFYTHRTLHHSINEAETDTRGGLPVCVSPIMLQCMSP